MFLLLQLDDTQLIYQSYGPNYLPGPVGSIKYFSKFIGSEEKEKSAMKLELTVSEIADIFKMIQERLE
jgi:hypothetical protein